nr:integrase, catalytic region, zinc finger, CCHC-type, peptidase aspartic, catalytic [Tanacetum cinerariifolium]
MQAVGAADAIDQEGTSAHGGMYGNVTVRVRVQGNKVDEGATVSFSWQEFLFVFVRAGTNDILVRLFKANNLLQCRGLKLFSNVEQNGVIERRNLTLFEATRTMLIYAKASLFLWAEAVTTACYNQNCSIIRIRHGKTPYEILHDKVPDLSFFHVFGALCYPTNDSQNLAKLEPKAAI